MPPRKRTFPILSEPLNPALIDTHEAARRLGVTYTTMRLSRASGVLMGKPAPEYLKFGRAVRYDQATLAAWIAGAQIRTRIHDNEEETAQ